MPAIHSKLSVKLTGKDLMEKYFIKKGDTNQYVCKLCNPEFNPETTDNHVKTIAKGKKGFTWVTQHLEGKLHKGAYETHSVSSQTVLVSDEATSTFDWIDWIVAENRELDFCEKARVRKHTKGNLHQFQ